MLAVEPSIDWIDCQARKDVMNFYQFDPIAGHGIDVGTARRNPRIVAVRFRDIIRPEHYKKFRWQFFRVHFQFVMANERPDAYDFFMIVCGPVPLSERMAAPDAALAIATGDPGRPRNGPGNRSKPPKTTPWPRPMRKKRNLSSAVAVKNRDIPSTQAWNPALAPGWLWRSLWCKA